MTILTTDRPPEGSIAYRARARIAGFLLSIPSWLVSLIKAGPHGLAQVLAGAFHFARDERRAARIDDMTGTGHARQLIEEEIHQRAMKIRSALVILPPTALALSIYLGLLVLPWWQWAVIGAGVWLLLGFIGLPEDAPRVPSVIYMDVGEPKITENLIIDALAECGIPKLTTKIQDGRDRGYQAVRFHDTPHRDGAGVSASLTLPAGVTVDQVNDDGRRKAFAGGLERSEERILITRGEHEARMRLFVADQALRDLDAIQWDLLPKRGAVKPFDIFDPIPVGVDLYGRPATISAYRPGDGAAFGIGAGMTGAGKTASCRLVALGAALDPTVELHLFDFKGGTDWEELGLVLPHDVPPDVEVVAVVDLADGGGLEDATGDGGHDAAGGCDLGGAAVVQDHRCRVAVPTDGQGVDRQDARPTGRVERIADGFAEPETSPARRRQGAIVDDVGCNHLVGDGLGDIDGVEVVHVPERHPPFAFTDLGTGETPAWPVLEQRGASEFADGVAVSGEPAPIVGQGEDAGEVVTGAIDFQRCRGRVHRNLDVLQRDGFVGCPLRSCQHAGVVDPVRFGVELGCKASERWLPTVGCSTDREPLLLGCLDLGVFTVVVLVEVEELQTGPAQMAGAVNRRRSLPGEAELLDGHAEVLGQQLPVVRSGSNDAAFPSGHVVPGGGDRSTLGNRDRLEGIGYLLLRLTPEIAEVVQRHVRLGVRSGHAALLR